jgi:2-polyprenyl-3-methyl-5-hydroxy-6-metoxy-1,4-benzoquinol methylase
VAPCPICGAKATASGRKLGGFELYACPDCELRFAPDAFDVEVNYTDVYDSPEYIESQVQSIANCEDSNMFASMPTYLPFFQTARHPDGATLIDLGCGVGRFCHAASGKGWNVSGIDISERAISIGKRHAKFPMRNMNIEELIATDERYDVATAFEVLEHLSDPGKFLVQMRALLKPGGQVFCTVPNWGNNEVQNATQLDWIPPIHLLFFSKSSLAEVARRAGFQIIVVGEIWCDAFPAQWGRRPRWIARRIVHGPRSPLGLWIHASV